MTWWITGRRVPLILALTASGALLSVVFGSRAVPAPNLLHGAMFAVPLALFLPLVGPVILVWGLSGTSEIEEGAVRPIRAYDAGLLVTVVLVGVTPGLAAWAMSVGDDALMGARNLIGYSGFAVMLSRCVGPLVGGSAPTGLAILAATFGSTGTGAARWWAWPLARGGDLPAAVVATVLLLVGIGALLALGPRERFVG